MSDIVVVLVTTLYTVKNVLDWGRKVRVGMICSRVSSVIPGTCDDHSEAEVDLLANERPN